MALKLNSQKLLLFLYHPTKTEMNREYALVKELLPDLTAAGRRSLLAHLQASGLIYKTQVLGTKQLSLTNEGRRAVEAQFPCFSQQSREWQGQTQILIFLSSTKQDKSFRYLRKLLTSEWAIMLRQGTYLLIGSLNESIVRELQSTYRNHVVVLDIQEWSFGTQRDLLIRELNLQDIIEQLSGISSELNEVLRNNVEFCNRTDQQKEHIFSVFDRLLEITSLDLGIGGHYFPDYPNSVGVLTQFHELF